MANTTNFGWETPDDTDLVKDGAAAMRTLGNAIDTSFVDLKGGTTGQILSKASNTDLDYTWVSPNPGDITGVTAGTGLTGGGTSGDVTVSIDPTYYLLANQTRRNPILNSNFSVWQRGTNFTLAASTAYTSGFTADRWQTATGTNQACQIQRSATGDSTNLPNIQYCLSYQRNSGQTGTGVLPLIQNLESVNSIPFAGKTVTLSFYARAGANYSAASNALGVQLYSGTGTDQNAFSTYTGAVQVINSTATLTTTWQRFTFTGSVGATATELAIQFNYTPTGTAGANDYYQITGVQLEIGSSATDYRPNGNTYQQELAACQRYYFRRTGVANALLAPFAPAYSTTGSASRVFFPQTMRVVPTSVDWSDLLLADDVNTPVGVATLTLDGTTSTWQGTVLAGVASGLTQYRVYGLRENGASGYIGFSAEL